MTLPLRVLGNRVLVKPDEDANAPITMASGVMIAKSLSAAVTGVDPTVSVSRGTVIALGHPQHPFQHETFALAQKLDAYASRRGADHAVEGSLERDAAALLRDLVRKMPCCAVGDDVLFSHDSGQQITVDGLSYIVLDEADLLAIVEPELESV